MDEEMARRLATRFLLAPNEPILAVRQGLAALRIVTDVGDWLVRPVERAAGLEHGAGYALYDATQAIADARRAEGIAVLPDGAMFHLNDPTHLRAFFAATRTLLQPLDLATILAFYQSDAPGAESVIATYDDLAWLFPGVDLAAVPALSLPELEGSLDGAFELRYCTLYLADDPSDRYTKVNLNRGRAAAAPGSPLTWSVQPLARNLDSPRYRP